MSAARGLGAMLAAALIGAGVAAAVVAWRAPAPMGDVRGYLLDHPEVIPEALDRLQAKQGAAAAVANRAAIVTPFPGAEAGDPRGDVTLTEFYDYACGYCRQSVADVDRLVAGDPRLHVVFKQMPVLSAYSDHAARLALAAARAGRFAAYHHALFAAGPLGADSMAAATRLAGVTSAQADTPAIAREVETDLATVRALHLSGTPTFVVGDQVLPGAIGYDQLKAAVAAARNGRG